MVRSRLAKSALQIRTCFDYERSPDQPRERQLIFYKSKVHRARRIVHGERYKERISRSVFRAAR